MADLSKVKIGESLYNLKDNQARTAIAAEETRAKAAEEVNATAISTEETRAKGVESGLDTRVSNLEARGRFLSNYNVATGLPTTYPTVTSYPFTYTFKSGDYYIVGSVPASGTKYMPSGSSISKASAEAEWVVGKVETSATISVGGQFVYDGTNWVYVSTAKDVVWGIITGDLEDQTDLQAALDDKVPDERKVAGINLEDDITVAEMQTALGLEDLAYAGSASGSYTPAGTISEVDATPAGTVTLNDFTQTATDATLTKAAYTPAGSITGSAISGGSINVTVKDASSATAVTDLTYENYTPAGTIAAKATGGTSSVLASAAFEADASGVAITGTVSKPAVTITAGTEKTFATGLTGGSVASIDTTKFSGGSFTGASAASFTQGAKASFTQGAKASLTEATTSSFAKKVLKPAIASDDAECLVFNWVADDTAAGETGAFSNAVTDRGTFTANGDDNFTANGDDSFTANNVGTFTAAAISNGFFTANTLQSVETDKVHDTPTAALAEAPTFTGDKFRVATTTDTVLKDVEFAGTAAAVKLTGAKYLKQEIDEASFSGTAATLGFSGTEVANFQVTGVSYDKATANGASFSGTTNKVTPTFTGTAATITVDPD